MIGNPCCPSAGPTGGAGVAAPAEIVNLINVFIFLPAIMLLSGEIRNSNYRNSKQIQNRNDQNPKRFRRSNFVHLKLFRDSCFGFRIFYSEGFTLIELLVTMGIIVVVGAILVSIGK